MAEILITIQIQPLDAGYLATSTVLEALVAAGRTVAETMEIAEDVARKLIESYREHGDPLPPGLQVAQESADHPTAVRIPVAVELEPVG